MHAVNVKAAVHGASKLWLGHRLYRPSKLWLGHRRSLCRMCGGMACRMHVLLGRLCAALPMSSPSSKHLDIMIKALRRVEVLSSLQQHASMWQGLSRPHRPARHWPGPGSHSSAHTEACLITCVLPVEPAADDCFETAAFVRVDTGFGRG